MCDPFSERTGGRGSVVRASEWNHRVTLYIRLDGDSDGKQYVKDKDQQLDELIGLSRFSDQKKRERYIYIYLANQL